MWRSDHAGEDASRERVDRGGASVALLLSRGPGRGLHALDVVWGRVGSHSTCSAARFAGSGGVAVWHGLSAGLGRKGEKVGGVGRWSGFGGAGGGAGAGAGLAGERWCWRWCVGGWRAVVGGGRGSRGGSLGRSLQGWEVVFGLFGLVL
jgi:hypothetical protein